MAQVYEIPLTPAQEQRIGITLKGVNYVMLFRWLNAEDGGWTVDLMDSDGIPIIAGMPLVTGADLLAQYEYLNLGGGLVVNTDGNSLDAPTFANLGRQSKLYYITAD